jgi:N-acetyl-D-muramate 6-phosphate phosphatase
MSEVTSRFAAVLFDLDGTLLDSARDLHVCLNKLCHVYQQPPVPLMAVQRHLNQGALELIRLAFGDNLTANAERKLQQELLDDYALMMDQQPVHFFSGVLTILNTLTEKKICWGIVTNKAQRFTIPILKNLDLLGQAAVVLCGDQVGAIKPSPEPLFQACQQLAVAPSACCYVGDSIQDMLAANAAAMPGFLAHWGYWLRLRYDTENWPYTAAFDAPQKLLNRLLS